MHGKGKPYTRSINPMSLSGSHLGGFKRGGEGGGALQRRHREP